MKTHKIMKRYCTACGESLGYTDSMYIHVCIWQDRTNTPEPNKIVFEGEKMKTWDFLPEFVEQFEKKLKEDDVRWGDTWIKRTRKGQDERLIFSINNRVDRFLNVGQSLDYLTIIGETYINWIRENHPELWKE